MILVGPFYHWLIPKLHCFFHAELRTASRTAKLAVRVVEAEFAPPSKNAFDDTACCDIGRSYEKKCAVMV
jgi:hypothetical protein